ncbi:MAG: diguanylate cyclase [Gammaproteobacteria bacterium]|nr:diguanylate cyclase [Gammaproteobacteria bacterium]
MTQKKPSIHERMMQLRNSFMESIPTRLSTARIALTALEKEQDQLSYIKQLHHTFHSIKGNAASFTLDDLSLLAKQGEEILIAAIEGAQQLTPVEVQSIASLIEVISYKVDNGDLLLGRNKPFPGQPLQMEKQPKSRGSVEERKRRKRIYICDDDSEQISELANQLDCFGYDLSTFTTQQQLEVAIDRQPPEVIIMDIVFPDSERNGLEWASEFNQKQKPPIPIIYISGRDDFSARMRAVKSGGIAYCLKPLKPPVLLELLDEFTNQTPPEPLKVMIVDDEKDVALYHSMLLEEAGMITTIVTQPELVIQRLTEFNADLVLMDLYMPLHNGPDLALLLRQIPGYVSLPIIYLSSETDSQRQLTAMAAGADGFLTKPVHAPTLIQEIKLRGERMRLLRSFMIRDSLTGLLNHTTIKERLAAEVSNASRRQSQLCFAMIDIDHFKQVNDTYGHPVGDQVILALSRLLQQRMRGSDAVGRYGGEEFAMVLTDISGENALKLLESLRLEFSSINFYANEMEFSCTFSCGYTLYPQWLSANTMTEAADRALYRAKHEGRNRIESLIPDPEELS